MTLKIKPKFVIFAGLGLALGLGGVAFLANQEADFLHGSASEHCLHTAEGCEDQSKATDHSTMNHGANLAQHGALPTESGQSVFGAVSEINKLIDQGGYDWAKVDLDALWEHLRDMDAIMVQTTIQKTKLGQGLKIEVSGEGAARRAMANMIPAHSKFLSTVRPKWDIAYEKSGESYVITVLSDDAQEVERIQALGFAGFMVQDDHHASHHLGIATGAAVH